MLGVIVSLFMATGFNIILKIFKIYIFNLYNLYNTKAKQ